MTNIIKDAIDNRQPIELKVMDTTTCKHLTRDQIQQMTLAQLNQPRYLVNRDTNMVDSEGNKIFEFDHLLMDWDDPEISHRWTVYYDPETGGWNAVDADDEVAYLLDIADGSINLDNLDK